MEKLKFPVFKGSPSEGKTLSMDDYVQFVQFCLKYTCDRKEVRKQKREEAVYVRFVLKS